jgi:uncharacterized protein (TIGR02996 family)
MSLPREEEAFLKAVRAAPGDDTPRLIYADYLTERGDPRGEFIRVQCELANMDENDPLYAELSRRERMLLDAHRVEWSEPIRHLVAGYQFRRGFVEKVIVTSTDFLAHAETLFGHVPLQSLRLVQVTDELVQRLAATAHLSRLTALDLSRSRAARRAHSLSRLSVSGLRALVNSPHLTDLASLNLSLNERLGNAGAAVLAASLRLPNLIELFLSRCAIGPAGALSLTSSSFAQLMALHLSDNPLGNEGVRALACAPHLSNLTTLHLSGCRMSESAVRALVESPYLTRLTDLRLTRPEREDLAEALIARFGEAVRLEAV